LIALLPDDLEKTVLKFIIEKKGTATKNRVVEYMNTEGHLSRVPTLNLLDNLESSGKILVSRGNGDRKGQAHLLSINTKNAYNRINNWLSQIEKILDEIEEPLQYVYNYIVGIPEPDPDNPDPSIPEKWYAKRTKLFSDFSYACNAPIERLLDFLFILSNRIIQSERDSQLLNEKIVDLNLKLMKIFNHRNTFDEIDFYLKEDISTLDGWINNPELRRYTKEPQLSIDFGFNMLDKIKKFRKELVEDFSKI